MACDCDDGWTGPHCGSQACSLQCKHGGTPDASCKECTGCRGGWSGPLCDTWNATVPAAEVLRQIDALKNASYALLLHNADLCAKDNLRCICKITQECVGWGVDLGAAGSVASLPLLFLDFAASTPHWHGYKFPAGTTVKPRQDPQLDLDTRAFPTIQEHRDYVSGLWASMGGRIGWYAKSAHELNETYQAQFPKLHDAFPSVTQAPYDLYEMDLAPNASSPSGYTPGIDYNALAALQSLPPTYESPADQQLWDLFFQTWGTSVVVHSHSGGLLEYVSYAHTALRFPLEADWPQSRLVGQAREVLHRKTGLGATSEPLDPTYAWAWQNMTGESDKLTVFGGDGRRAQLFNFSGWFPSVVESPVLTSYELAPLSLFVEDAALASAVEAATSAYLTKQRRPWADLDHCPRDCTLKTNATKFKPAFAWGLCRPGDTFCTCKVDQVVGGNESSQTNPCRGGRMCSADSYPGSEVTFEWRSEPQATMCTPVRQTTQCNCGGVHPCTAPSGDMDTFPTCDDHQLMKSYCSVKMGQISVTNVAYPGGVFKHCTGPWSRTLSECSGVSECTIVKGPKWPTSA
jgi:hypothetical protein